MHWVVMGNYLLILRKIGEIILILITEKSY